MHYREKEVMVNLARSFPEKKYKELNSIRKKFYRHLGDIITEAIWFGACRGKRGCKRLRKSHLVEIENAEVLNRLFENSTQVMAMESHTGNWELVGGFFNYDYETPLAMSPEHIAVTYNRLHSAVWDQIMADNRCATLIGTAFDGYLESREILRYAVSHRRDKRVYVFITDQFPYKFATKHHLGEFMHQPTATITTANTTETIPRPLLDRMEVISISGYTSEEKLNIAKKYLVPKQIKANGLKSRNIKINQSAINELINSYTRESGVRGLEKEIANLCRKVARKVVEGDDSLHSVTSKNVEEYLGKKKFHYDKQLSRNEVGVATGLAWTIVGGDTLFIETACLPGTGQIVLTGQLGSVMQESARAAISYIRAHVKEFGVEEDFYKTKDIHIHIPEGATPKDGPSAGVTMCVSVLSALTGRAIRKNVAMTGEISLRGKILPVGGIKEKVIAAHRLGVKKVLLPEENSQDLDDLPKTVRDSLEFVLISVVDDAVKEALI